MILLEMENVEEVVDRELEIIWFRNLSGSYGFYREDVHRMPCGVEVAQENLDLLA